MKKGQPKNQKQNPSIPWRLYLIIGFIALPVFGAMGYLLQQTKNISDVHDTILGDIVEIEHKSMAAHLWFEEILSGDSSEKIDLVRDLLKQAEDRLHALIGREFDSEEHTRQHAAGDPGKDIVIFHLNHKPHVVQSIQETLESVEEKLNRFKNMLEKRYFARQTSGPGTEIDQRFDRVFAELMGGTGEIIKKIKASKANHLAQFRVVQIFLISLCLALTVLIALILHRFERRRTDDLLSLSQREEALLESEEKYQTILTSIEDSYFEVNQRGKITFFNEAFSKIIGYPPDELMGMKNDKYLDQESRTKVFKMFNEVWKTGIPIKLFEYELIRKNGEKRTVQTSISLMTDENGQKVGFRGIIRDVSYHKQMEKALQESEERFRLISRSAHDGILMMDHEGKISYWNEAAIRIFGYSQNEALGRDLHRLLAPEKYLDAFNKGFNKFAQTGTGSAIGNTLELTAFRKDKSEFPMELSLSAVEVKGLWHSIGVIRDISERKQAEEELKRLSYLDGLTGVANRRRFDEALGLEWKRMTRDAEPLSLIMCDIDFFKAYNDTYGHQAGDDSLRQVANTLNSVPERPGDLVARYGGEEFAVILPGTDSQGAKTLAEKMRVCVESLGIIHVSSQVCEVLTISLGVATTIPTRGSLPDELISAADQALYKAKKDGRNRVNLDE